MSTAAERARLGVFKLASCDGCQLSVLDLEDELLTIAGAIDIVHFPEASSAMAPAGPFDLVLVEGSVSTPEHIEEIRRIRDSARVLVAIGACATAGGIQALRNFADHQDFIRTVYAHPEYIDSLDTATPLSDHVEVDLELRGCPIAKRDLLELVSAILIGRKPNLPNESVCLECKRNGNVCLSVASGEPCLGPVTHGGCGALCPSFARGCFGCFGPVDGANTAALANAFAANGRTSAELTRLFRQFTGWAEAFRNESCRHE